MSELQSQFKSFARWADVSDGRGEAFVAEFNRVMPLFGQKGNIETRTRYDSRNLERLLEGDKFTKSDRKLFRRALACKPAGA